MIPGFTMRVTKGGVPVLRIHYSADPNKRPGSPAGDSWINDELRGYPGGVDSPRWKKEMEIDYGALGGEKIFPALEIWKQKYKIVIPPIDATGCKLYGSYDHGWRKPAAYHVHAINYDGIKRTVWEFYGAGVTVHEISQIIKGKSITASKTGERYEGNPFADHEISKIADPQIWTEDQMLSDNTMKSTAYLFEQNGIYFEKGNHGGDTTVIEWILGTLWRDLNNPLWQITSNCVWLLWEMGRLRHKQLSAKVAQNQDQPEQLVDKENHAWDGIKMFLQKFPPTPQEQKASKSPGSFEWWRKQAKAQSEGGLASTYRREF